MDYNTYIEDNEPNFADWLGHILSHRGISQSTVARSTGASAGAVCHWLSNKRLPSVEYRIKLAAHIAGVMVSPYKEILSEMLYRIHVSEWRNAQ